MNEETKTLKRGKTNGYSSAKLWAKRGRRVAEATERQEEHDSLTAEEKIAKAKGRPGHSKREIARLTKLLPVKGESAEKPKAAKKVAKKA